MTIAQIVLSTQVTFGADCAQHSDHVWRRLCSALGSHLAQVVLSTRMTIAQNELSTWIKFGAD